MRGDILFIAVLFTFLFQTPHRLNAFYCQNSKKLTIIYPDIKAKRNRILTGMVSSGSLFLGLKKISLSGLEVSLNSKTSSIEMTNKNFVAPGVFLVESSHPMIKGNVNWELKISDVDLNEVDTVSGEGVLPEKIIWMKKSSSKKIVRDRAYFYSLKVFLPGAGFSLTTAPKPFVIYAVTTLKYRIPLRILSSYKKMLVTPKFQKFLNKVSGRIKEYPDNRWNIIAYLKPDRPDLCENLFRLRNNLITKNEIPIERFHTFCEMVDGEMPDMKYVSIIGTRPRKEVKIPEFKEKSENIVIIDGRKISVDDGEPFLFPPLSTALEAAGEEKKGSELSGEEKPGDGVPGSLKKPGVKIDAYALKLSGKTGEELEMRVLPGKYHFKLRKGLNREKNFSITLQEGFEEIFCGEYKKRSYQIMAGIGPYSISDSFAPGDFHAPILNLLLRLELRGFFRGFNLEFDATLSPKDFIGSSSPKEGLYYGTVMLGRKFDFPGFEATPYAGYFAYSLKDNVYKTREFTGSAYNPALGASFSLKKRFFLKITIEDRVKLIPGLFRQNSSFAAENNLVLNYAIKSGLSLFMNYKKHVLNYKERENGENFKENIDAAIFGVKLY